MRSHGTQARLALLVGSLAASLLIAEAGMRWLAPWWSDQWKMWRIDELHARGLQRNVRDAIVRGHSGEFAFRFSTNAQGLRMDRDLPPGPARGPRRRRRVGATLNNR